MPQAEVFIGVQASGKTTFYKERFFTSHIRISLDMLKTRHRELLFLQTCLQSGQSFVVDNTNPTAADRQRYILPARAAGFEVLGYYFESRVSASLQRNQGRLGKERIPAPGIRSTFYKLQLPALAEGFDQLYVVKIAPDDSFIVDEWKS
jgi:predicted kinase